MKQRNRLSDNDFDALVESFKEESFNDAKEAYGEKGFERWRKPKFNDPLKGADIQVALKGKCGDTIQIFLKFNQDKVTAASYQTSGCASSQLAGSFTAELSIGKSVEDLFSITAKDVVNEIGKLPEKEKHCAELAVQVLHECANKYLVNKSGHN